MFEKVLILVWAAYNRTPSIKVHNQLTQARKRYHSDMIFSSLVDGVLREMEPTK